MGTASVDVLLPLATHRNMTVRRRAVDAITRLGAADRIDWFRSLELDLSQRGSCNARRETVARLRALKDARAIPVLRRARDEKKGVLSQLVGDKYKHGCIRKEIIEAIEYLR